MSGEVGLILSVSRVVDRTQVLGPGTRAAIWVRGCPLRCRDCVSPEDLPFEGGERVDVRDLARHLNGLSEDVTGVTFSGGEPMAQAAALAQLVDLIRARRNWSVMSYSGFTLEHLHRHGSPGQRALLDRVDILVDGPYLVERHADLLWRGSANQRLHFLTSRHRLRAPDRCAGLELEVTKGALSWVGVPPVAGFRAAFESAMRAEGVNLTTEGTN